jgi:hypothetical protein
MAKDFPIILKEAYLTILTTIKLENKMSDTRSLASQPLSLESQSFIYYILKDTVIYKCGSMSHITWKAQRLCFGFSPQVVCYKPGTSNSNMFI